jgi:ankyrin repeat protein
MMTANTLGVQVAEGEVEEQATHSDIQEAHNLLIESVQHGKWSGFYSALKSSKTPLALVQMESSADKTTALHWAALNARLGMALQLIRMGAKVNALGGPDMSSPLHWASTKPTPMSLRTIHLLVNNGADIYAQDGNGYAPAHIAAQYQDAFLLVLFLSNGFPVDTRDRGQYTLLHWAIFREAPVEVLDVLFTYGGREILGMGDQNLKTPLHWAVQLGHYKHAKWLLEKGDNSFINMKDVEGKTPKDIALKSDQHKWYLQMESNICSAKSEYMIKREKIMGRLGIMAAFITLPTAISISAYTSWVFGLIFLLLFPWICTFVAPILFLKKRKSIKFNDTGAPFVVNLSGMLLLGIIYCVVLIPDMVNVHPILLFVAAIPSYILTMGFLLYTCFSDPGFVPAIGNSHPKQISKQDKEKRSNTAMDLAALGLLDERHYCTTCEIRKPIRSKHCRLCNRCVSKMDHHCPWTWNCIGSKNYFSFIMYVFFGLIFSILTIVLFVMHLNFIYNNLTWDQVNTYMIHSKSLLIPCVLWSDKICTTIAYAPWSFFALIATFIFMPWLLLILLCTHIYQISKALTSNEMANSHRLEYFYPTVRETLDYEKALVKSGNGPQQRPTRPEFSILPPNLSVFRQDISDLDDPEWRKSWPLYRRPYSNPFDAGLWGNWVDFFCTKKGPHGNIKYDQIYDRPLHCIPKDPSASPYHRRSNIEMESGDEELAIPRSCKERKCSKPTHRHEYDGKHTDQEIETILPQPTESANQGSLSSSSRPRMQSWLVKLFRNLLIFPSSEDQSNGRYSPSQEKNTINTEEQIV